MEGYAMRFVPALLGLCLVCLLPACAGVETLWYTQQYTVVIGDRACPAQLDADQGMVFITTEGKGPSASANPVSRATALQRAKKAAQSGIFDGIRKMKVTGYATVGDLFDSVVFADQLKANIELATIPVAERWDSDTRQLLLISALPCTGPGSVLEIAARMLERAQADAVKNGGLQPYLLAGMRTIPSVVPTQYSEGPYTGVVIDTTGLNYSPALLVKLVTQDGGEAWGTSGLAAPLVMKKGEWQRMRFLDDARVTARAGAEPLLIRPLGVVGPLEGDLLIRESDVKLLALPEVQKAMTAFAIIIVTD
jgi:hypothetical protein